MHVCVPSLGVFLHAEHAAQTSTLGFDWGLIAHGCMLRGKVNQSVPGTLSLSAVVHISAEVLSKHVLVLEARSGGCRFLLRFFPEKNCEWVARLIPSAVALTIGWSCFTRVAVWNGVLTLLCLHVNRKSLTRFHGSLSAALLSVSNGLRLAAQRQMASAMFSTGLAQLFASRCSCIQLKLCFQ